MPRTVSLQRATFRLCQQTPQRIGPGLIRSSSPRISQIFHHSHRTYLTDSIRAHQARKMAPNLDGFFKQVDTSADHFIERLKKAVAIPSISAEDARRPDVIRMGG
uniref:Uncharacterized protein n=1 Tax=Bionectria ochroleuca TaxID=29856 RepID=A0A8H7KBK0_BIOOC